MAGRPHHQVATCNDCHTPAGPSRSTRSRPSTAGTTPSPSRWAAFRTSSGRARRARRSSRRTAAAATPNSSTRWLTAGTSLRPLPRVGRPPTLNAASSRRRSTSCPQRTRPPRKARPPRRRRDRIRPRGPRRRRPPREHRRAQAGSEERVRQARPGDRERRRPGQVGDELAARVRRLQAHFRAVEHEVRRRHRRRRGNRAAPEGGARPVAEQDLRRVSLRGRLPRPARAQLHAVRPGEHEAQRAGRGQAVG